MASFTFKLRVYHSGNWMLTWSRNGWSGVTGGELHEITGANL